MEALQSGHAYWSAPPHGAEPFVSTAFARVWGNPDAERALAVLRERYDDPARGHHDWNHIEECLKWSEFFFEHHPNERLRRVVELALFFHDAVYVPGRSDNEEESAALLGSWGEAADIEASELRQAQHLVRTTNDGQECVCLASRIVRDIDRSVLGTKPERYRKYVLGIREEFSCADWLFSLGRRRFVHQELRRRPIFRLPFFRERLEEQARSNLRAELRGEI